MVFCSFGGDCWDSALFMFSGCCTNRLCFDRKRCPLGDSTRFYDGGDWNLFAGIDHIEKSFEVAFHPYIYWDSGDWNHFRWLFDEPAALINFENSLIPQKLIKIIPTIIRTIREVGCPKPIFEIGQESLNCILPFNKNIKTIHDI